MRWLVWLGVMLVCAASSEGAGVFVRFRVEEPAGVRWWARLGGHRHAGEPWQFKEERVEVPAGEWTAWVDLSRWPWHARQNRSGGIAEWPTLKITVESVGDVKPAPGSVYEVQLADEADEKAAVVSFKERSESRTIAFLMPTPLREHVKEFETGSQMAARHREWAEESTGGRAINLKKLDICTSLWGHYDAGLAKRELGTLAMLGFNVVNDGCGVEPSAIRQSGFRMYRHTWLYEADPAKVRKEWDDYAEKRIRKELETPGGRWAYVDGVAHWVIGDETKALNVGRLRAEERDGCFREYLRSRGVEDGDLPRKIDEVEFPAGALGGKALDRAGDLRGRRLIYWAGRFQQWWSAKQLRQTTDLIHETLGGSRTETLPSDHGFFNAWGPPHIGMSYVMLDLFELGRQRAVDQLSAEDWLGLNHMYGPDSTWTGGQTFGYLNAVMRSAIGDRPIMLRSLITPSDDGYLRLKAYSALGQGCKSFFFWTYGPTYIGTENYWSDLRSQYDGVAKVTRAMAKAEDVLADAKVVGDAVAILYAVSHDYWHTDQPAAFVEKRLLWHGLRHVGIQPDFVSEEDVEAGVLKGYKVLFVTDWCVARKATAAIDRWVRGGGMLYLSAGAATRDEFYEPYVPAFARGIWPDGAAGKLVAEKHRYSERGDLAGIKAMGEAHVAFDEGAFDLPVIGCRLDLRPQGELQRGTFDDGTSAATMVPYGSGHVMALGFMPMLAYGQMAGFKPTTLEEKWPEEPRRLLRFATKGVRRGVSVSKEVVEASLLTGAKGSVVVLANYTYQPIEELVVDVGIDHPVARVVSTEGREVRVEKRDGGLRLMLPLECTEMVVLERG